MKATEKQENRQGDKGKRQNKDKQICQPKAINTIKSDDTKLAKKKQIKVINPRKNCLIQFNTYTKPKPQKKANCENKQAL